MYFLKNNQVFLRLNLECKFAASKTVVEWLFEYKADIFNIDILAVDIL